MIADHLPQPATRFVGRAEELSSISALLADPYYRLLTLVDPGGIGKTRLALEIARTQLGRFADGVYFVSLQAINSAESMILATAETLNLQIVVEKTPLEQLVDYLSGKSCLLLLDNFEHLLDGAELIAEILRAAPDVKILITSRERLNLLEEWVFEVSGLGFPASENDSDPEAYSAVQLFLLSAQRVQASFTLTAPRTAAVARICRLVGGMPLGIELAAAWVRVLPCDQLADQIERSLEILETSARNVPPRHRNMRAAFAPTWERLSENERVIFMKLSVFRGGFTYEAARQVAGATLPILASLTEKSLLRIDADERYDIHELLRQYGEEQLMGMELADSTRDAHSAFYADFCYQRQGDIQGHRQLEALDEIEADFENIRTAWLWAVEQGNFETIDRCLESLFLYCEMRSRLYEVTEFLLRAQAKFAPAASGRQHQVLGRLLARLVFDWREDWQEDVTRQFNRQKQALAIAQQYGNPAEIGYCYWRLGEVSIDRRNFADTLSFVEQSLIHYRAVGDRYYIAKVLNEFGMCYREMKAFETAFGFQKESLALRREIGDYRGIGWCLYDMGRTLNEMGRFTQAVTSFEEAARIWRKLNDRFGIRCAAEWLGFLALLKGEFELGRTLSEEAQKIAIDLRLIQYAVAWGNLGFLAILEGDYVTGKQLVRQFLEIMGLTGPHYYANWGFALSACGLEDYRAAKQFVAETFSLLPKTSFDAPLFLPVSAYILSRENQPTWGVELLGLAYTYPDEVTGWIEASALLAHLRADLQAQLGAEAFAEAWERGRAGSLEAAKAALLAHFQPDDEPSPASQPANRALVEPLSEREMEVLRLIAQGLSNQEIADQLVVGIATVKKHINHLYGKLGVQTRTQALVRAREWELV